MQTLNYAQSPLFGAVSRVNQKTSSKKKIDVSAERRPLGAGCIYKDFLTRAKDFAVKEGHVRKMKTYFFVGRLIVGRFSQCVAKVR